MGADNNNKWLKLSHWNKLKYIAHFRKKLPYFKTGEIWWCYIGENVGIEINGKSEKHSRPVYVAKKLSGQGAIVLPLTSQPKTGRPFYPIKINDRTSYIIFSQVKTISALRLVSKMATIDKSAQAEIKEKFLHFFT
jgi:mRNA-degrading endonuclease toxin of MazEF toxin-antitoxin module